MGTMLYAITDTSLKGQNSPKDWQCIVKKLKAFQFETTSYPDHEKGGFVKEEGDWDYELEDDPEMPFNVDFYGPFQFQPCLYSNVGVIFTIYRYTLLYQISVAYWFDQFRRELFQISQAIGGSEIIFLADNCLDKLSYYLECMAYENEPYEKIKQQLLQEFGKPVTHYADLDYEQLDCRNINEFFLDDFSDLKP